jgi:hypothetical protein
MPPAVWMFFEVMVALPVVPVAITISEVSPVIVGTVVGTWLGSLQEFRFCRETADVGF